MSKELAQHLASYGRNGDSTLVHMHPAEVQGLAALAHLTGKNLTTNPHTGLPEAFFLIDDLIVLGVMAAEAASAAAATAGSAIAAGASAVGGALGSAAGAIGSGLGAVGSTIGEGLGALGGAIGEGAGAVGSAIGEGAGALGNAAGAVGDVIGQGATAIGDALGGGSSATGAASPEMTLGNISSLKDLATYGSQGLDKISSGIASGAEGLGIPKTGAEFIGTMGKDALVGGVMGGAKNAITGQDIGQGIGTGALGGATGSAFMGAGNALLGDAATAAAPGASTVVNPALKSGSTLAAETPASSIPGGPLMSPINKTAAADFIDKTPGGGLGALTSSAPSAAVPDASKGLLSRLQEPGQLLSEDNILKFTVGSGVQGATENALNRGKQNEAYNKSIDALANQYGTAALRAGVQPFSHGAYRQMLGVKAKAAGGTINEVAGIPAISQGYFNQQPMQHSYYPQAMIPQAQPMQSTTPIHHDPIGHLAQGGMAYDAAASYAYGGPVGYGYAQGGETPHGSQGLLDGPGDGLSDGIAGLIQGEQGNEPVRLATGEYIIPADTVSALGGGSTKAGALALDAMLNRIRKQAYGHTNQIRPVDPAKVLPA